MNSGGDRPESKLVLFVMAVIAVTIWTCILMTLLDVYPRVDLLEDGSIVVTFAPTNELNQIPAPYLSGCLFPDSGCGSRIDFQWHKYRGGG